jgi:hypothetical protein
LGRPKAVIDQDEFLLLYEKGFSDQVIADHFCVHRSTIARKRQQMSLSPVRKRGERGPGTVHNDLPYYVETFRLLKHLEKHIKEEARIVRSEAAGQGNEEAQVHIYLRSWLATGVEPAPVPHPVPEKYAKNALRPKSENVRHLLDMEYHAARAGLAGVPGPAIIKLAQVYKTADERTKSDLTRQAIAEAGYVGVHETVEHVIENGLTSYDNWVELWRGESDTALQWASSR